MEDRGKVWLQRAQRDELSSAEGIKIVARLGGSKAKIAVGIIITLDQPPVILAPYPMRLSELRKATVAELLELREPVEVVTYNRGRRKETICYFIPWSLWEA